jgi:Fur family transcriptional regulator, ferric uptake regulator
MSRQRLVILEELKKVKTHPTADEVYEAARLYIPRISLATVYRNLEALAEDGAIQKLQVSGSQMRFDGDPSEHCHIRCTRCGQVDDIEGDGLVGWPENTGGYELTGCRVEFAGICPVCRRIS